MCMHDTNLYQNTALLLCCIAGEKYLPDVEDEDNDDGNEHQQQQPDELDDSIDQELPASALDAIDK
jgi:hypothetical protein